MLVLFAFVTILFLAYAGLLIYYRGAWKAIPDYKVNGEWMKGENAKISVIIPARNEADNIGPLLQSLQKQSYPKESFEIIVVDDHSTDNMLNVINSFNIANLQIIPLKDYISGTLNSYKKKAIEVAVEKASGDLIVTTDADCIVPEKWLETIASFYVEKKPSFIAAPVSINCSFSFIEIFQSLDFMTLQGITGASVHKKFHSMCNGANLAYERKAFYDVGGFKGIDNIASGDDMLLMHKIAVRDPSRVMFLKSKDAIVQTAPVKTIAEFFNQRIRWASKADKYDDKRILPVLVVVYFFNLSMLLLPIAGIFRDGWPMVHSQWSLIQAWLILLLAKTLVELFFLWPVAGFFNKKSLLWLFPVMQPFHILYTVLAGFLGKFGTYKWKERKVK